MPNRIIHEKACNSPTLDALSDGAERLFWRLTTKADDYGRFDADPRAILGACFPLWIGRMKPERVRQWRDELATPHGTDPVIRLYVVADREYGEFVGWATYQRNRYSKPKFPAFETGSPLSAASCGEPPRVAASRGVYRESLSRVVNERREASGVSSGGEAPPVAAEPAAPPPTPTRRSDNGQPIAFQISPQILAALARVPKLGAAARLHAPQFWQAEFRANPGVDWVAELFKAEAWLTAHPEKHYRRLEGFFHTWLAHADRPPQGDA